MPSGSPYSAHHMRWPSPTSSIPSRVGIGGGVGSLTIGSTPPVGRRFRATSTVGPVKVPVRAPHDELHLDGHPRPDGGCRPRGPASRRTSEPWSGRGDVPSSAGPTSCHDAGVTPTDAARYRELAEAAWRWVLAQVEDEDGPRIPARVDVDTGTNEPTEDGYRDGLHEGIGGLAHVLAEIRLSRSWTEAEADLAAAVAERLQARIPEVSDVSFFDGLSSIVGALIALDAPGADEAVHRLLATAETDGWPPAYPLSPEKHRPGSRINDATLGTASVLLAAVWALRRDVPGARALAERAVDILLAEGEPEPTGTN